MAKHDNDATAYYWDIAAEYLQRRNVDKGSLMGFPCLRINGNFFSTCDHRTGSLIIKLPKKRVEELIADGRGSPFAPAGRIFKEWVLVERRHRGNWIKLMDEALTFCQST